MLKIRSPMLAKSLQYIRVEALEIKSIV